MGKDVVEKEEGEDESAASTMTPRLPPSEQSCTQSTTTTDKDLSIRLAPSSLSIKARDQLVGHRKFGYASLLPLCNPAG